MEAKPVLVLPGNEQIKRFLDQIPLLQPQERGTSKIQIKDHPLSVKYKIADRGKVIKVGISAVRCLQIHLGSTQFFLATGMLVVVSLLPLLHPAVRGRIFNRRLEPGDGL